MLRLRRRRGMLAAALGLLAIGTTATMCAGEFDTTRRPPETTGTVGQEVFRVVCERVHVGESPTDLDFARGRPLCTGAAAASGDGGMLSADGVGPKVFALAGRRAAVVDALDRTITRDWYARTDALLVRLLPLYGPDNGMFTGPGTGPLVLPDGGAAQGEDLLPQSTRALGTLLLDLANDRDAARALARFSRHQGYRPPRVALGLTRSLLAYPQLGDVLASTLALFREGREGRPAGAGHADFNTMLDVLRGELANAAPAPAQDQMRGTTLDAVLDLALRSDMALGTGRPRYLVRRDRFGMPRVNIPPGASLPPPFVDTNPRDGLADSDEARFIDAQRRPIDTPSPFPANETREVPRDAVGRAVYTGSTVPVYQYVDLDQTLLAAILRDAYPLVDPSTNTALRLVHGASPLFGPRANATRDYMLRHECPAEGQPARCFDLPPPAAGAPAPAEPPLPTALTRCQPATAQCAVPPVRYSGYDTSQPAPMVDLVHALGTALTFRDIDPVMTTVESLVSSQEPALARSLAAMLEVDRVADATATATIDPRSNIWDDVADVIVQIARQPGLLEDILAAASDQTATVGLARAFGAYANHRDRIEPRWTTAEQNASLAARTLTQRVDRTQPDTQNLTGGAGDNRSAMQRLFHLIHDLSGVELCNREGAYIRLNSVLRWPLTGGYRRCELFRIPDAAVFYLKAIDGTARIEMLDGGLASFLARNFPAGIDSLLEGQSGITGFDSSPTPEAINRFVFQPDSIRTEFMRALLDPPVTRDGVPVREVHPGTIFVWETNNFFPSIRPLVRAFLGPATAMNRDARGALFVRLISAMHLHYATDRAGQYQRTDPRGRFYSTMDGAVRYEPIIAAAFNGDLPAAAAELARVLPSIDVGSGRNGRDAIAGAVRMLFDPEQLPNLAYRDGRQHTLRSDGTTRVDRASLYYMLADAFNGMDAAFATRPAERDSWETARSTLVDTFLAVDGGGTPGARFRNRNFPVVGRHAVRWVRERMAAHRMAGDYDAWARGLGPRFADTVRGPAFGAGVSLLLDVYSDAPARAATGGLLRYLLDDSGAMPDNNFGTTLTALADLVQILRADDDIDPLLRALAPAFQRAAPAAAGGGAALREEAVPIALRFLDRARDYDTDRVLDRLLANLAQRPAMPLLADEPIVVLGDAIAETHRVRPGAGGPLDAADFTEVLSQVAQFFLDDARGMEQFYYIVQHRRP